MCFQILVTTEFMLRNLRATCGLVILRQPERRRYTIGSYTPPVASVLSTHPAHLPLHSSHAPTTSQWPFSPLFNARWLSPVHIRRRTPSRSSVRPCNSDTRTANCVLTSAHSSADSGLRLPLLCQDLTRDRERPEPSLRAERQVRGEGQGHLPEPGPAVARELNVRARSRHCGKSSDAWHTPLHPPSPQDTRTRARLRLGWTGRARRPR